MKIPERFTIVINDRRGVCPSQCRDLSFYAKEGAKVELLEVVEYREWAALTVEIDKLKSELAQAKKAT